MRTAAILPVKRFSIAKQRLCASVAMSSLREELAQAMVGDVLGALGECDAIAHTIVVTDEPTVKIVARQSGALVVPDTVQNGQSAAVGLGIETALGEGFEQVVCVPGDCPTLDPLQLEELLSSATASADAGGGAQSIVVVVPDRHGTGTNALLLSPPDVIAPSFGPGSCARHRVMARTAGATCHLRHPSSLLLDVDTGEDLRVLKAELAGNDRRAPRTRTVLGRGEHRYGQPLRGHDVPSVTAI